MQEVEGGREREDGGGREGERGRERERERQTNLGCWVKTPVHLQYGNKSNPGQAAHEAH